MKISETIHSGEMSYEGERVLLYELSTLSLNSESDINYFNKYNSEQLNLLFDEINGKLYKRSIVQFDKMNNPDCFTPFKIRSSSDVLYNSCNILSVFTDIFYSFGADGSFMKRQSQTWNKKKGELYTLKSLFITRSWQNYLFSKIKPQIKKFEVEMGIPCFPNWKKILFRSMAEDRFYLTMDGVAVYVPQGYISSNIWGIPTFLVKYNDIKNIMRLSLD